MTRRAIARTLAAALLVACGAVPSPAQTRPDTALRVSVTVAADTIVFAPAQRYRIAVRASRPASVVATVERAGPRGDSAAGGAAAAPREVVWRSDTVASGAGATIDWDFRASDGTLADEGRYTVAVTARDPSGAEARAARTVAIRRLAPDTQPLPLPLTGRELRPETVVVGFTTPWAVVIAVGAVAAPSVLGRMELRSARRGDSANLIVGGTVLGVGMVAFLTSHRPAFSPENAQRNAETRRHHAEQVAEVEAANARARERVGYWVWIDEGGP